MNNKEKDISMTLNLPRISTRSNYDRHVLRGNNGNPYDVEYFGTASWYFLFLCFNKIDGMN